MAPKPDLSVVLPAFEEQARLPRALQMLRAFGREHALRLEVIVSSDGSRDGTASIARAWGELEDPLLRVSCVENPHRGKGAAVRAGMQHVTGRVVGYCDVDMSAGPDAIVAVYEAIRDGADIAIASRGLPDSQLQVRQPWHREQAGRAFNLVLRRLTRISFHDTQCGLKLFRPEVARQIFRHQRLDGFAFDAELLVLAVRLGYDVREVPVRWSHDKGSRLSFTRDAVLMARDTVRIVRRLGRGEVHQPGVPALPAIDRMASSEDRHWWYVAKRKLVGSCLDTAAPPGPCLDVGCGAGAMVVEAGRRRPAYGVDLSAYALDHARQRGVRGLVCGEAARLPFADRSFAGALALDVIEHHPNPDQLLGEIRRILVPDGVLVVTVPAFQWMWSYADHVLGHYRRYTKAHLARELSDCGFSIDRMTYFHSWLLPAAWLFRKLRTLTRQTEAADDFPLPRPLNALFLAVATAEMRLLGRVDLPFGLSLLAVARPVAAPVATEPRVVHLSEVVPDAAAQG